MVRAKIRVAKKCEQYNWSHLPWSHVFFCTYMYLTVCRPTCIFCFSRTKKKTRNRKYRESREKKLRGFCSLRSHYKLPGKLRAKLEKSYSGVGFFMGSFGRVFGKNIATFLTSRSFTVNENAPDINHPKNIQLSRYGSLRPCHTLPIYLAGDKPFAQN